MGKIFLLKRTDFKNDLQIPPNFLLKNLLEEKEADEFLIIQNQISNEITEELGLLTKERLTKESIYAPKGLIYCISKNDNEECVGYGHGYIDFENRNVFYLDTIGVHSNYRRQGIGIRIKVALIEKAFENSKIEYVKAITQIDNDITIAINERLGFKTIETNETEK